MKRFTVSLAGGRTSEPISIWRLVAHLATCERPSVFTIDKWGSLVESLKVGDTVQCGGALVTRVPNKRQ